MNRFNKTQSDVFLYFKLSVFLKDPFFLDYYGTEPDFANFATA